MLQRFLQGQVLSAALTMHRARCGSVPAENAGHSASGAPLVEGHAPPDRGRDLCLSLLFAVLAGSQ